jgi:hypothetical protein
VAAERAEVLKLVKALESAIKGLRATVGEATGGAIGGEDGWLVEMAAGKGKVSEAPVA